ncbi:hypothetical protein EDB92DRAFT_1958174 [Lactarius akahatsu]|uniref:Uncharacterized protein n=1 Tax=Lactarius akahatsu TaxID=416441 RepID=A0AAD4L2H7_9AGAM|nr:hypothetical protein EDB92DRAFT_1958174 [Lactarius akahatsu]
MSFTARPVSPPALCTFSPAVLSSLALRDECPPLPRASTPFTTDTDDDFDDLQALYTSDIVPAFPDPPSVMSLSGIKDDTTPFEGVKTSNIPVSTPPIDSPHPNIRQYPPLFLSRALERLRDPDEVEPITPQHHTSTPRPDSPTLRIAIIPTNHPLQEQARTKHEREGDADDENPHKQPSPQLGCCTNPLPKFVKYRPCTNSSKYAPLKKLRTHADSRPTDQKLKSMEEAETPTYNAILLHLAYRY